MRKWEYVTAPLLAHNTKAILDNWGSDGWELVSVVPGPAGPDSLVGYFKRPLDEKESSAPDAAAAQAAQIREQMSGQA